MVSVNSEFLYRGSKWKPLLFGPWTSSHTGHEKCDANSPSCTRRHHRGRTSAPHSFVSFTTKPAPAACCEETLQSVTVVSLHVETRVSISAGCARRRTRSRLSTFNNSPAPRRLAVWVRHDVQEAEEGELQRARLWTRVPRRRHLFPLVQVRQLQDCWLPDRLVGGVQLQDSGVLWWDAAQELQQGKSQRKTS